MEESWIRLGRGFESPALGEPSTPNEKFFRTTCLISRPSSLRERESEKERKGEGKAREEVREKVVERALERGRQDERGGGKREREKEEREK